ncbi:acyl-CoA N-acyltransferase [Schizophyllum amplum]|uniref:Acyl-CoA N-acyltransferase n=1 Tax=Schizophyllum amplum TaxID=97359 RepID=A0A550BTV6_9AGAR|nr:acyl-CoA N-acyltransferase [Auriculariopsis ampla]
MSDIIYDLVAASDLEAAIQIERDSYPADEAATLDAFRLRQSQAGDLFLGAYLPSRSSLDGHGARKLVGYICSTTSPSPTLTHESMSTHVAGSPSVCIHSVCVSSDHRRRGIALGLLREYIARLEADARDKGEESDKPAYERILLITHDEMRPLYEKAGFTLVGPSAVQHGSKPWLEMRWELGTPLLQEGLPREAAKELPPAEVATQKPTMAQVESQQLPPGLFEALQRSSTRSAPKSRLLSAFEGGIADVCEPHARKQGAMVNKYDLLCPRAGCGSVILKKASASWTERASVQMEPVGSPASPHLATLPTPPETTQWWLVTPSAMAFENIGFSNTIPSPETPGSSMKLLSCAECDLGPVGWNEVGSTEFWLAAARVGYRV